MKLRKTLRRLFGQAERSGLFYSLVTKLPVRLASDFDSGFDLLGGITVISLSLATVILMRFLLIG